MTVRRPRWDRIGYIALLVLVVLVVVACATPGAPGAVRCAGQPARHRPTPQPPLTPAQPGADPISFLAWLFTPIFQVMFIILVAFYDLFTAIGLPAAIGWAIVDADPDRPDHRHPALPAPTRLAAPDAAAPARGQGDPAPLQGRRDEGARRPAGAVQGARHQPARRLPPAPPPDAAPVHHVFGHPERPDERRPDADAGGLRPAGRPAGVQQHQPGDRRARRRTRTMHRHDHPVPRHEHRRQQAVDLPRHRRSRALRSSSA